MVDRLRGGGEEGEHEHAEEGRPAEGVGQHEERDERAQDERGRFAAEEHEAALEAVGDGAADEAEEQGGDAPGAHEEARIDDLEVRVDLLHPEDLGDEVEGLHQPHQHRARQQEPEVPVAEGTEHLDATVGHGGRVYGSAPSHTPAWRRRHHSRSAFPSRYHGRPY